MGKNVKIRLDLDGIYGWGKGFYNSELYYAWEDFWKDYDGKSFGHFKIGRIKEFKSMDATPYIYGLYGCLHCHPMEITGELHTSNSAYTETGEFQRKELLEIAGKLAEYIKDRTGVEVTYRLNYFVYDEVYADKWQVMA